MRLPWVEYVINEKGGVSKLDVKHALMLKEK
jgi:hypothetical protein